MAKTTVLERFVTEFVFEGNDAQLDRIERRINKVQSGLRKFGTGMMVAGAGLTAGLFSIGKAALDFETNMNAVAAASGVTGDDFDKLREQALHLGRTTSFSAGQAAEAQKFLAQAGFDTNQILSAMPNVLNLAASGQMDLAQAAQTMTSSLAGFNLEATESQRVADVFAKAASSAKTTVYDMGRSLIYAAPIATELGISIESVSAASATLQDKGMRTEMAGTALKTMFSRLVAIAGPAAKALEEIGIAAPDIEALMVKGKWKEALAMLKTAGMDVGVAQKVFGMEGFNAVVMLSNELDDIKNFEKELYGSGGTSDKMAKRMLQGLPGAIKILQSQIEGLKIALADAGITKAIIGMAAAIGVAIDWFQGLSPIFQEIIAMVVAAGPILLGLGTAFNVIAWALGPMIPLFSALASGIALVGAAIIANPIGAAIMAIIAAVYLVWQYWDEWIAFWRGTFESIQMWLMDNDLFVPIMDGIQTLKNIWSDGVQFLSDSWLAFVDLIFEGAKKITGFFSNLIPDWMKPSANVELNKGETSQTTSRSPILNSRRGRTETETDQTKPELGGPPGLTFAIPDTREDTSGLTASQAQERTGGYPGAGTQNTQTTTTNIDVGDINVDARGGDSEEIVQNMNRQIRYNIRGVAEDQDSNIAL